jgi:hypothetical protein
MATVVFAPFIQHYVKCPSVEVFGNSVREVLEMYFQRYHHVRRHIVDEQGCLRPRLALFVDGAPLMDRIGLSDPVHVQARVLVQPILCGTEYDDLD